MPDSPLLYTRNYLYDPSVTIQGYQNYLGTPITGAYSADNAIDRDEYTSFQSAFGSGNSPGIVIYLGPTARTIDTFIYYGNIQNYQIQYGNDGTNWTTWTNVTNSRTGLNQLHKGITTIANTPFTAKYIYILCGTTNYPDATYKLYEIAFCSYLGEFDWQIIEKLNIYDTQDTSYKVNELWNGMPFVSSQSMFNRKVSMSLTQMPVSVASPTTNQCATYEQYRQMLRTNPKVMIIPEPVTNTQRWIQGYFSQNDLNYMKPRTAGIEGTIEITECI